KMARPRPHALAASHARRCPVMSRVPFPAAALVLFSSLSTAQDKDPLLKEPEKKAKGEAAKIEYLTAWPKPHDKDQLLTDIERLVKASIPEMAEGGKQGLIAEGAAAVPFVIERYGKERDDEVVERLRVVLVETTKADQTRMLAKEFDHRDVRH